MIRDSGLNARLVALMLADPSTAPLGLLERSLEGIGAVRQRGVGVVARVARTERWRGVRIGLAMVAIVAAVVIPIALIGGLASGPDRSPEPTPSAGPSAAPSFGPPPASLPAGMSATSVFDLGAGRARSVPTMEWLTSGTFGRSLYFWVDNDNFCQATSGDRWLVLAWKMSCYWNIRLALPDLVACGTAPAHPTAAQLVAAMTSIEGLGAVDLGAITDNIGPGVFLGGPPPDARIVAIPGTGLRILSVEDPNGCVVSAGTDRWEVRADVPQTLVLVDVADDLVIIRAAAAQDSASAIAAQNSGYLQPVPWNILGALHDVTIR